MNKPIINTEIDVVIKKVPRKQKPRARCLHKEILATIKEKVMPTFLKLFQKIIEEGTLPNSFYEATITLIPKPDKGNKNKKIKLQANTTDEHRCKNP